MPKPRTTSVDQDGTADSQAFRAAVRDVTPLAHSPLAAGMRKPKRRAPRRGDDLDTDMPLIASAAAAEVGSTLSFHRAGVRDQVMRRLRRGLYPIEAELDLHGLNQSAARERLADFIGHSQDAGCRCVRIIHGKGYRSGARGPVLKAAVNLWLRRHSSVSAFISAREIDGGTGALYVLLRA